GYDRRPHAGEPLVRSLLRQAPRRGEAAVGGRAEERLEPRPRRWGGHPGLPPEALLRGRRSGSLLERNAPGMERRRGSPTPPPRRPRPRPHAALLRPPPPVLPLRPPPDFPPRRSLLLRHPDADVPQSILPARRHLLRSHPERPPADRERLRAAGWDDLRAPRCRRRDVEDLRLPDRLRARVRLRPQPASDPGRSRRAVPDGRPGVDAPAGRLD